MKERRKHGSAYKAKVAIEALKERETITELAAKYQLHPTQINTWKKHFLDNSHQLFDEKIIASTADNFDKERQKLFSKIGELQVELDFVKKKLR